MVSAVPRPANAIKAITTRLLVLLKPARNNPSATVTKATTPTIAPPRDCERKMPAKIRIRPIPEIRRISSCGFRESAPAAT